MVPLQSAPHFSFHCRKISFQDGDNKLPLQLFACKFHVDSSCGEHQNFIGTQCTWKILCHGIDESAARNGIVDAIRTSSFWKVDLSDLFLLSVIKKHAVRDCELSYCEIFPTSLNCILISCTTLVVLFIADLDSGLIPNVYFEKAMFGWKIRIPFFVELTRFEMFFYNKLASAREWSFFGLKHCQRHKSLSTPRSYSFALFLLDGTWPQIHWLTGPSMGLNGYFLHEYYFMICSAESWYRKIFLRFSCIIFMTCFRHFLNYNHLEPLHGVCSVEQVSFSRPVWFICKLEVYFWLFLFFPSFYWWVLQEGICSNRILLISRFVLNMIFQQFLFSWRISWSNTSQILRYFRMPLQTVGFQVWHSTFKYCSEKTLILLPSNLFLHNKNSVLSTTLCQLVCRFNCLSIMLMTV